MNLLAFSAAFIFQFVGHRIGDYLVQTHSQAMNKSTSSMYRLRHCVNYSLIISLLIWIPFNWKVAIIVFLLTLMEHYWIDSRTPVIKWKIFIEKKIARNKSFNIDEFPTSVLTEVDQSIHYVRIFIISLLIGYLGVATGITP